MTMLLKYLMIVTATIIFSVVSYGNQEDLSNNKKTNDIEHSLLTNLKTSNLEQGNKNKEIRLPKTDEMLAQASIDDLAQWYKEDKDSRIRLILASILSTISYECKDKKEWDEVKKQQTEVENSLKNQDISLEEITAY